MPSDTFCPRFGLLTSFDARDWSGAEVIKSGGTSITLPTYSGVGDGLFPDMVAFLTGYCVFAGQSIPERATSGWTGGGAPTFSAGIDEDDLVWMESDTSDFTVAACAQLGFAGTETTTGAGPYRMTASSDWVRGNWASDADALTITPVGGGATYAVTDDSRYQDVRVALRPSTTTGVDSGWYADCLEASDNTDSAATKIRWGVTDDGYVYTSRPAGKALSLSQSDFRDRLGFRGDESFTAIGGLVLYVATHPAPGVIVPTRPLDSLVPAHARDTGASSDTLGRVSRVTVAEMDQWSLRMWVDGPSDTVDLSQHMLRRWLPYADDLVTLYQEWGDSRRRLDPLDTTASQNAYDIDYTSQASGYRGRIPCRLVADAPTRYALTWPETIRRRSPLSMTLQEDGDA